MAIRVERPSIIPKIDENSHLGLHIKKRRLELGLSQPEVGRIIGVGDEAITTWELGRHPPKIMYAPKIIAFLGYNPYPKHETESFGGKVKLCRLLLGLSHRKMGKVLNADPGTTADWESNRTKPIEPRLGELTILLQQKINCLKTSSEAETGSAEAQPVRNSLV
jgi:DNA-binding transcriptional regulator YiaG